MGEASAKAQGLKQQITSGHTKPKKRKKSHKKEKKEKNHKKKKRITQKSNLDRSKRFINSII